MKAKLKWLLLAGVLGLALLAFAFLRDPMHGRLHAKARKQWKDAAIANIERRVADVASLERELATIKAGLEANGSDADGWFNKNTLLLKNGDWIAYASQCSKEDGRIHDIFIGRASDGKWYYSTYHFCVGMLVLRMDGRPESLPKFISDCSLREFDGRSDECLNRTWPPMTR